ncbi:hypothetical protein Y032_0541g3190 [Ancylostoma ceylanicum]|nr:hypothetical protein Y032_0541g3190 [Ancylostoma ceylanicum]
MFKKYVERESNKSSKAAFTGIFTSEESNVPLNRKLMKVYSERLTKNCHRPTKVLLRRPWTLTVNVAFYETSTPGCAGSFTCTSTDGSHIAGPTNIKRRVDKGIKNNTPFSLILVHDGRASTRRQRWACLVRDISTQQHIRC